MECVAPSGEYWRNQMAKSDDDNVQRCVNIAWSVGNDNHIGPPYSEVHHDWVVYRATTLREARKRGLDLSCVRLRT